MGVCIYDKMYQASSGSSFHSFNGITISRNRLPNLTSCQMLGTSTSISKSFSIGASLYKRPFCSHFLRNSFLLVNNPVFTQISESLTFCETSHLASHLLLSVSSFSKIQSALSNCCCVVP